MTVGARLQKHRKNLGLSQEELGKKLLVSRQTISLWEKDQTMPTIDNLKRLSDIFSTTIDEILGTEGETQAPKTQPEETYCVTLTKEEYREIYRSQRKHLYRKPIIFTLLCLFLIVFFVIASAHDILIGLAIGILWSGSVSHVKGILAYRKGWKNRSERIYGSTYEYKLFADYMEVKVYRNKETVYQARCDYKEMEQRQLFGKWLILRFDGYLFVMRRSELKEDSALYAYMSENPSSVKKNATPGRWKSLSILLFVASLLSIPAAILLVGVVSDDNKLFTDNLWLFFLLTPIPLSSVVFGFRAKAKGYKCKKNIITGIIMTALLCLYGSFSFLFADVFDHSDAPIVQIEQLLEMDIPAHKQINTQDWTKGTQNISRGYIYWSSNVYFDDSAVEEFEKQLASDDKWLSSVPSELVGIASPLDDHGLYDYVLIYNMDTAVYNTLPSDSGKYRFLNVLYRLEDNRMEIVEYQMDYVK